MNRFLKHISYPVVSLLQLFLCLYLFSAFEFELQSGIQYCVHGIIVAFALQFIVPALYRLWIYNLLCFTILMYAFGLFTGCIITAAVIIPVLVVRSRLPDTVKLIFIITWLLMLAMFRYNVVYMPRLNMMAACAGAIIMFRIFSMYYYKRTAPDLASTIDKDLAYILIFPNVFFLLFPIIDYKNHVQLYNSGNETALIQKGIRWMLRGITHLIAYRFCYHYIAMAPHEVNNLLGLLQYCLGAYLLILRISGIFHFSLGLMCLFGFNLPPVFNNYFLAAGFLDTWRRINIYWREFMQRLFFNPLYLYCKKKLKSYTILVVSFTVFGITCLLHNYQWFWLRGTFSFKANDLLFWLILGVFVSIDSYRQQQKIEKGMFAYNNKQQSLFRKTVSVLTSLFMMSLLWSLWNCESLNEWIYLVKQGAHFTAFDAIIIIGCVTLTGIIILLLQWADKRWNCLNDPEQTMTLLKINCSLLLLFMVLHVSLQKTFFKEYDISEKLFQHNNNLRDKENLERGYYKELIEGNNPGAVAWETQLLNPLAGHENKEVISVHNDLYVRKLIPGKVSVLHGIKFSVNSFGMHDKNYTLSPPAHTIRFGLLGGSYEMGSGLADGENFESLAETALNKQDTMPVELLNFSVGAYKIIQHVKQSEEITPRFKPHYMIYFCHNSDKTRLLNQFVGYIRNGTYLEYNELLSIKKQSGVKQSMSEPEIRKRLEPFMNELLDWAYKKLAGNIRQQQSIPVWVFMPVLNETEMVNENNELKNLALKNGFLCLSLADSFIGYDPKELMLSEDNTHPNKKGHQLLAEKFEIIIRNLMAQKNTANDLR